MKIKIKASVVSATEKLKKDLDLLETNVIGFNDIQVWCDKHGSMHYITRNDAERIADLLTNQGVRVVY